MEKLTESDIDLLQWLLENKIMNTKEHMFKCSLEEDEDEYNFYSEKLEKYYSVLNKIIRIN